MKRNNFLYLCLICFVFISTSALTLSGLVRTELKIATPDWETKTFSPIPVIADKADFFPVRQAFPIVSAQAVLAVDMDSRVTLYEKDADKKLLPASTTKIVTALVAMDYFYDDQVLEVGKIKVVGQKMGLVEGEKIKIIDLINGLLIYSANDAAEVLAQNYMDGRASFIAAMNQKAKDLHLDSSNFTNPTGLDTNGDKIFSSARDLVRVSEIAMKNPEFAKIVGTKEIVVTSLDGKIVHRLTNVNELLGRVPGVLGVKTGWTENARENLVTYIERDGHKIIIAVLGSQDRFGETGELIDWIFANYEWKEVKVTARRNTH